jgi:hypothetical protein
MIEVAQEIRPAPFTTIVGRHTHGSDHEHDRTGSHPQPGLVHVSLRTSKRCAAYARGRHAASL